MKTTIYLTSINKNTSSAMKRYLKYIFEINTYFLEKELLAENSIIFIDENILIDDKFLNFFMDCSNSKFIVFGNSKRSNEGYINLLCLSHLKSNTQFALKRKKMDISPLFFILEIELKIKLLFMGHGEKSLFDRLNIARQALINGPELLKNNLLNWNEYKASFLNPGIESWNTFKQRLNKYEIYLKVCGFKNDLEKINHNIRNFEEYIEEIRYMKEEQIKKIPEYEIKKKNSYLQQIDISLSEIKRNIDSIYDSI